MWVWGRLASWLTNHVHVCCVCVCFFFLFPLVSTGVTSTWNGCYWLVPGTDNYFNNFCILCSITFAWTTVQNDTLCCVPITQHILGDLLKALYVKNGYHWLQVMCYFEQAKVGNKTTLGKLTLNVTLQQVDPVCLYCKHQIEQPCKSSLASYGGAVWTPMEEHSSLNTSPDTILDTIVC